MDEKARRGRRSVLQAGASVGAAAIAGCSDLLAPRREGPDDLTLSDFQGSGALGGNADDITAPSIEDLPELSGSLSLYLGGGEGGLYTDLLNLFKRTSPDFDPGVRSAPSAQQANTIVEEMRGGGSSADVFWSVDAGPLALIADAGHALPLPDGAVESVPEAFRPDNEWVATAGRARAISYNTDRYAPEEIPTAIEEFPGQARFQGAMGWAPTYSAFQSMVTAMRLLKGEDRTRSWLEGIVEAGVREYRNEFLVSNAVADGELGLGFANHYYALRVQAARSAAPIDLAFTTGDAGALINTAGVAIVDGTEKRDLAETFVRYLLSAEAQVFFATRTFAYPMVPGVPPAGDLPRIDQLDPPDIDLSALSDLEPTLELLREVGLL